MTSPQSGFLPMKAQSRSPLDHLSVSNTAADGVLANVCHPPGSVTCSFTLVLPPGTRPCAATAPAPL